MRVLDPSAVADRFEGLAHARRKLQVGLDPEKIYTMAVLDAEDNLVEHELTTTDLEDAATMLRMLALRLKTEDPS